jgi:site-specific recombinase XerD
MTPLAPHVEAFLRERLPVESGASPHTCDNYAYALKLLFLFASKQLRLSPSRLQVEHLAAPLVLAFLEQLEKDRQNQASTRNTRLAAIKSFMRFLEYRLPSALDQIRRVLAIPLKKTTNRVMHYLSRKEMLAVLNAPDPGTRYGVRDRAMLYLGFSAGLRVSEIIGMRITDVMFQPRPCLYVRGKGRRERTVVLWKDAASILRAWLVQRGDAIVPELFFNARGEPMTRAGFAYVLAKYAAVAAQELPSLKAKRVSPHVLRHTCALIALEATRDLRKVSLLLGHASMKTTEIYTRIDPREKLDTLEAVLPPSLRRGRFRTPDRLIELLRTRPEKPRSRSSIRI